MNLADRIVDAIVEDITDRRGLRQLWDELDDDVRSEIIMTWTQLIRQEIARTDFSSGNQA